MPGDVRILLLADSHLGFDLPVRPRVERRRRGHDFLANYARALRPALDGEVDLVVHAGDVFDRPGVIASVAFQAFEPLRRVADRGVPVCIVPGNHERGRLPHLHVAAHPRLHVFDAPRTFAFDIRGTRVALAGFPYERHNVRASFRALVEATGWRQVPADHRLLCVHHCVEGATVGPADYVFTTAEDVIRPGEVPPAFAALVSGHIHRHQVLTTDRWGRSLEVPVLYPGSIERTALAEIGEPKGYLVVTLGVGGARWEFQPLPARPMLRRELPVDGLGAAALDAAIRDVIAAAPPDAVLAIRISGALTAAHRTVLSAAHLRTITPASMNVDVLVEGDRPVMTRRSRHSPDEPDDQLRFDAT